MSFTWPAAEDPHDEVSAGEQPWAQRPPPARASDETPEDIARRRSAEVQIVHNILHAPTPQERKRRIDQFAHWALDETRGPLLDLARSKKIFSEARKYSRRPLERPVPPPYWPEEAQIRVIEETITDACTFFERRGLKEWAPERAGLLTYFINTCKMLFPDAYNRWVRETRFSESITERGGEYVEVVHYDAIPDWDNRVEIAERQPGPDDLAIRNIEIERALAPAPVDDFQDYVTHEVCKAAGFSEEEARKRSGLSISKVKTRKKQHQRFLQQGAESGAPTPPAAHSPAEALLDDEQADQVDRARGLGS
ncbi:hypothetical protein E0H75_42290 [Kribbella capetownensis]|uniref:Uncharacterized protein n=1 Tax=Kribbella capetownensis TaxID=1572659 RepID=A0A4R0IN90_9ACTN|nr:hypothetical protein [Kribbella capetownensis]TCC33890.1 hypothetical protein E0H75_42290 [Kribbella capetownensis]